MAEQQSEQLENHDALNDHDPQYEPIISLPEVNVPTLEEEEEELVKLRAKLFRYDRNEVPPEWKERGTGDIKLLRHTATNCVRIVMRRDKTLKLCANHYVKPWMELKPSHGSDRAWVYSVEGDFADGEIKQELLAVRFANPENAKKWKDKFEEAKLIVETPCDTFRNGASGLRIEEHESANESDEENSDGESGNTNEDQQERSEEDENIVRELEKLKVEEVPVGTDE